MVRTCQKLSNVSVPVSRYIYFKSHYILTFEKLRTMSGMRSFEASQMECWSARLSAMRRAALHK